MKTQFVVTLLAGYLLLAITLLQPIIVQAASLNDLNQQIQSKQQKLQELKQQVQSYQAAIAQKQLQTSSLRQQLAVVEDKITRAELELEIQNTKLSATTLKIQQVTLFIAEREQQLARQRAQVAETLRQLRRLDEQSLVVSLAINSSLSKYYDQIGYLEELEQGLQRTINQVHVAKAELEREQQDLASYHIELVKEREELERAKSSLTLEQESKQNFLKETRQSESRYQSLLAQTIAEQQQANKEIQSLEDQARKKLGLPSQSGNHKLGEADFMWPVAATKGLSTYFHDPTYIFRRYFEHPGIDIPRPQGSNIQAAADGYVAQAKDAGLGYSYIMLIHRDNFATVYGHISRIDVAIGDYVSKGQVIGAVGGLPGTRGAGQLTTGSHLHFEVRLNGLPVNALDYLP